MKIAKMFESSQRRRSSELVDDGDLGGHADGDHRRVGTDHPGAEDDNLARSNARHAAEQDA